MTTNLITAITVVTMTTNTVIQWPKRIVADPCPDKMIGCLVFHSHTEDDTSATARDAITEIREIHTVQLPEINGSLQISNILRSRIVTKQVLAPATWTDSGSTTNPPNPESGVYMLGMQQLLTAPFITFNHDSTNVTNYTGGSPLTNR